MDNKSFDSKRIAKGYKTRPFLHKQVIDRFIEEIGSQQFKNGLDVGCGAGLSAKALKLITCKVTGTDISPEMIEVARDFVEEDGFEFYTSKAEDVNIPEEKYDIVSAAGMVNWVDRNRFMTKMSEIIEDNGYLLIYDFWISDTMMQVPHFTDWWHNEYLVKFPRPFRNEDVWNDSDVKPFGFQMIDQVTNEMYWEFDMDSFIDFMMIQSNVNAKIEGGELSVEDIKIWFEKTLSGIFERQIRTLVFKGYSWYIKKGTN